MSHPTGVRGLKFARLPHRAEDVRVAPHWGAWIEITASDARCGRRRRSHPTGVRGLKYGVNVFLHREIRRTPLGCVD